MPDKKRKHEEGDPEPLNFDDERMPAPYSTPNDRRGDNEERQYYEEEEAISPEEVEERKKEGDL